MISLTGQYALRSVIFLAQNAADAPFSGKRIAVDTGIPPKYLSKVLGDLARCGVLDSAPGKTGGFRLRLPAKETCLLDVLTPFERFGQQQCPFGNHACSDENPCLAHDQWKTVVEAQRLFFLRTSVQEIAVEASAKKRRSPRH